MKTLVLLCATFAVIEGFDFNFNFKCKAPPQPYNGYYTPRSSSYKSGSKISLRCNRFFRPRKSLTKTCNLGLFLPFTVGYCDPVCPSGYRWTSFYDRDDPSATGDHETFAEFIKTKRDLCRTPVSIDAREKRTMKDYRTTGQKVSISPTLGLRCLNKDVKGQCKDYTVRFCCDRNECEQNLCDSNAVCSNTQGSYRCSCKSGYTGNGKTCTDIDECSSSPCHANAACTNTAGSYTCACNFGFTGDGMQCDDIDECQTSGICGDGAVCNNQPGSYQCSCPSGYTGDPEVQCIRVTCPPVSAPENGRIAFAKNNYKPGDYIFFSCNPHYRATQPRQFPRYQCQSNGEWKGHKPVCVGSCSLACSTTIKFHRGAPPCGCNETCVEEENCCSDYTQSCASCTFKCEDRPSCKCSGLCGGLGADNCCHNYKQMCQLGPGWPVPPTGFPTFTPWTGFPTFSLPTRSTPITWAVGRK